MMNFIKAIALLLTLCLIIPCVFACAETSSSTDETTAASNSDAAVAEESETGRLYADVPDKNYGGATFTILCSSNAEYGTVKDDFTADELTGEPINDARYNRNLVIESQFNIDLNIIPLPTGTDQGLNAVKTSVTAADNAYDVAMVCGYAACSLAQQNMLRDIKAISYIDLEKPWWDQRATEDLTVVNKLYFTTGDISTADNEATYCIMFNKNLINDYNMESPYQLVRDGKWTVDKYLSMTTSVSHDLDGNGEYDSNDQYGALIWDDSMMGIINGSGEKCCTVVDGLLTLSLYSEKTVDMVGKFFTFALDKTQAYTYQRYNWDDKLLVTMFQNNQALFIMQLMQLIPKLREMDADFGILPYFKYDEAQESYYTTVGSWHSVFLTVPKVQTDIERTGMVVEALACESMYTVTPAYYDITLKSKSARDEESGEMLDLIFQTRIYDLGWYYQVGSYNENVMNLLRNFNNDFTSMYTKSQKAATKTLDKINEKLLANDS